jgi:NADH-quinone oxidoreductase subunit G
MARSSTLQNAKKPLIIVGQGALARPDGAAVLGLAAKARAGGRRGFRRLERLCGAAYGGFACRRARHRLRAGRGRQERRRAWCLAQVDVLFLLGADELNLSRGGRMASSSISARMATRALTEPTSSCRARPTPKSQAPTSTPRAGCSMTNRAGFASRRRPRGLGDPARAFRCARQASAVRFAWRAAGEALCRPSAFRQAIDHVVAGRCAEGVANAAKLGGRVGKSEPLSRR